MKHSSAMFEYRKSLLCCVLFCLAFAVLVGYDLRSSYQSAKEDARERVTTSSYLISEWIKGAFASSDYVLRDIVSEVPLSELSAPERSAARHARRMNFLEIKRKTLANAFTIGLYDEHCIATHTSASPHFDASKREYCQRLKTDPAIDTVVTHAFYSSLGPLNVVQARGFPGKTPGFHGLALIGIDLDFFSKWLEPVSLRPGGIIAIFDTHLVLLARKPAVARLLGQTIDDPQLRAFAASADQARVINIASRIDRVNRVTCVRKVGQLPFIVAVGESDQDWLTPWRWRAGGEVSGTMLLWTMAILMLRNHWMLADRTRALESANRKLAALSTTDGLTGIANRRRFDEVLASEWARASRFGLPLALIMLDVDYFKKFNDSYGHQAGDDCLKRIAGVLGACAKRTNDLVARYGGEEFAVILPGTDSTAALAMAEAMRAAIVALDIAHQESLEGKVTASFGVANVISHGQDAAGLLRAADEALYRAKRAGRNQVRMMPESKLSGDEFVNLIW